MLVIVALVQTMFIILTHFNIVLWFHVMDKLPGSFIVVDFRLIVLKDSCFFRVL